jgi:hypothetical protein
MYLCTYAYMNLTAEFLPLPSILHIEKVTVILMCLALKWDVSRQAETFKGQSKGGRELCVYVNYVLSSILQQ